MQKLLLEEVDDALAVLLDDLQVEDVKEETEDCSQGSAKTKLGEYRFEPALVIRYCARSSRKPGGDFISPVSPGWLHV